MQMLRSTERIISKKLKDVKQLPTLPTIFNSLQQCLQNPNTSAKDIAKIIENDQSLASKILKTVNSAFYGFPREIATIWQSAVILGFREISNLALSISIINTLSKENNQDGIDVKRYWQHCLATAICAGIIAKEVNRKEVVKSEVAFIAGLLHDIGRLISDQFLAEEYALVLENEDIGKEPLYKIEYNILKYNHQDVGKVISNIWQLPPLLVETIATHHKPETLAGDKFIFVSTVHIADAIINGLGIGSGSTPIVPPVLDKSWECFNFSYNQLETIIRKTLESFEELSQTLLS